MKIVWQPKARKQIKKLGNNPVQARIFAAIAELAKFPEVANVKHLSNHLHGYRLRIGGYRVLFNVLDDIEVVSIEEVMKRDENTY